MQTALFSFVNFKSRHKQIKKAYAEEAANIIHRLPFRDYCCLLEYNRHFQVVRKTNYIKCVP